jgi:thioredoxin reductase (NADPH)
VRLVGLAKSNEAYELSDFLQRNGVAFDWAELQNDEDCQRELGLSQLANAGPPVVIFPDGTHFEAPTVNALAHRLGWVTQPRVKEYDVSIYGAGPAVLSAAVYAAPPTWLAGRNDRVHEHLRNWS